MKIAKYKSEIYAVILLLVIFYFFGSFLKVAESKSTQHLIYKAGNGEQTRWVSAENPKGEKGRGGMTNKGGKGSAFYKIKPGETKVLFDVSGAGVINRIWMTGDMANSQNKIHKLLKRSIIINAYWDGSERPAVSAPVGDFFGMGSGLSKPFQSAIFVQPEGRSFISTVQMPYKKSARIEVHNDSDHHIVLFYDINFTEVEKHDDDVLYFHAYWNRILRTEVGKDFEILPKINGVGRFLGTNISVIANEEYGGIWFGEGEVKMFLDGDKEFPTLVGTGTEDYIGSGYSQGEYSNLYQGCLTASSGVFNFYRYHIPDPIFFYEDCKVTLQQIGGTSTRDVANAYKKGAPIKIVTTHTMYRDENGEMIRPRIFKRLLEDENAITDPTHKDFPEAWTNFYRSDDVSSTAYFYLDKPENSLPTIQPLEERLKDLKVRVWDKVK